MSSPWISRRRTLLFAALAVSAGALSISACSSEPSASGTVALALAPESINVVAGGTGNSAATITRSGTFTGPVTLSATAPSGVGVTFTPTVIPAGSTTAAINVAVDAAVAAGAKTVTIRAVGDGVSAVTKTLTVVVGASGAGGIALGATPASLANVAVGAAAVTSAIAITRTAPFTGAVAMTVTGAPANVTANVAPASVPGGVSAAVLSVSAAAGAVNGTYPLVVHGTGTGVAEATTTVQATVTGGATAGVALTFSPSTLPLTAGGPSATSTVTVTRNGSFTGPVNLAFSAPPVGITATVNPTTVPSGSTTATVTVQAPASVDGPYNLTLNGTGTGIPAATGTLPVVVSPSGGGGNVTVTFCAENNPLWVAMQSGSGAWTRVTPTSGTTYQFTFTSGTGGVAAVQPDGSGSTDLNVYYGTVADFTAIASGVGTLDCGSKTVDGSAVGVGALEGASVSLGTSTAPVNSGAFELTDVPAGSLDLIAIRSALGSFTANSIILRRGLNQADNSTITPDLDFNSSSAFAPSAANTVALVSLGADQAFIDNSFLGLNGSTDGSIGAIVGYTGTAPVAYSAIPLAKLNTGELQSLSAIAGDASNANAGRLAVIFYHTPANQTITMGPDLSAPVVTNPSVSGTNAWPLLQLPSQAAYDKSVFAEYDQDGLDPTVNVRATKDYFGSLPATWNLPLPNFTGLPGWDPTWGLTKGTPINWQVAAQGGSLQFVPVTDGSSYQLASVFSSVPIAVRGVRTGADPFALQRRLLRALQRPLH